MSFEKVTIDQALEEYRGNLDAMGLNEADKTLFIGLMRASLEEYEMSIDALQSLILETPTVATGEYIDAWMIHEWRGPIGSETKALPDDIKPNHVRDAVQANF